MPPAPPNVSKFHVPLKKRAETDQDGSLYPSYTRLVVPYWVICRQRYARGGGRQRRQFAEEHGRLEMVQPRALDGVRIHREFYDPGVAAGCLLPITEQQKRRVEWLLNNQVH